MIDIEVFGESSPMELIAGRIDAMDGVTRVRIVSAARVGHLGGRGGCASGKRRFAGRHAGEAWHRRRRHHVDAGRCDRVDGCHGRGREPGVGRRARLCKSQRALARALPRIHGRGGGDRWLRRGRREPDPDRGSDGSQPRPAANHRDRRRPRRSPRPTGSARTDHFDARPGDRRRIRGDRDRDPGSARCVARQLHAPRGKRGSGRAQPCE